MIRAPDLAAIHAAELRVAQSARNVSDSLRRARVAFRATLVRPSTLALAAGAACLLGFWLWRRPRPQATSSSAGAGVAATASVAGLLGAFVVRYGMQYLPFILRQARAAQQKRVTRANPDLSKWPATGYPGTGVRH